MGQIWKAAAAGVVLLAAGPALAHHSGAMFDRAKVTVLKGTVKEYQFTQPHTWIELTAPDDTGAVAQWSIEAENPPAMNKIGLTRSVLNAGDMVTVRIHPLRDGRHGGSYIDLTTADGKVLSANHAAGE